jgi:4-hydroxybenzoate polyprenyltransferase
MHFLRLIRPLNLAIIAFTMIASFIHLKGLSDYSGYTFNLFNLVLLIGSTVIIAAAGNIINDYFDVKADRINKPEKLIITKHIKRRWAIVSHWSFNGIGFISGIYLSIYYQSIIFVFIHLISINLLWFYSMYFKRKVFIGNLIIAILTGMIPVLTLLYVCFSVSLQSDQNVITLLISEDLNLIYIVALLAALSNLSREIIKDIQDMSGDRLIYVKSLPMVIGVMNSKIISTIIMILVILLCLYEANNLNWNIPMVLPLAVSAVTLSISGISLFLSDKLKISDQLIKVSMLFGVISFLTVHS